MRLLLNRVRSGVTLVELIAASVANFKVNETPPPGYTTRDYTVQAVDCDQDAANPGAPDCFEVTATVHWDPPQ